MGTWGPKLYQDDVAEEVRDYYKDQLKRGKTEKEVTLELISQYQSNIDEAEKSIFWFALADTQWNLGRLETAVKEKALFYLNSGIDLKRWELENPKQLAARTAELCRLKEKLLLPQPAMKKINPYRFFRCQWKRGDVFAYLLQEKTSKSDYPGRYMFFVKVDEINWHPGHIIPVVYVYRTLSPVLLSVKELQNIEFVPQFYTPQSYESNPGSKKLYQLALITTSAKAIPQNKLEYVGNIGYISHISGEDPNPYAVNWKDLEEYSLENFKLWGE